MTSTPDRSGDASPTYLRKLRIPISFASVRYLVHLVRGNIKIPRRMMRRSPEGTASSVTENVPELLSNVSRSYMYASNVSLLPPHKHVLSLPFAGAAGLMYTPGACVPPASASQNFSTLY